MQPNRGGEDGNKRTVRTPSDTVPTNLRRETPLAAMAVDGIGNRGGWIAFFPREWCEGWWLKETAMCSGWELE